jgi:hypothetical protein
MAVDRLHFRDCVSAFCYTQMALYITEYHDFDLFLDKRHWDTAPERDSKFEVILTLESSKNLIKNCVKVFNGSPKNFSSLLKT